MNGQKIYKTLFVILKNILAFIAGGIAGMAITLLFARPLLESAIKKDVGLGIIALAPVVLIIYSIIFGIIGGISGIIVYNLFKKIFKQKT